MAVVDAAAAGGNLHLPHRLVAGHRGQPGLLHHLEPHCPHRGGAGGEEDHRGHHRDPRPVHRVSSAGGRPLSALRRLIGACGDRPGSCVPRWSGPAPASWPAPSPLPRPRAVPSPAGCGPAISSRAGALEGRHLQLQPVVVEEERAVLRLQRGEAVGGVDHLAARGDVEDAHRGQQAPAQRDPGGTGRAPCRATPVDLVHPCAS